MKNLFGPLQLAKMMTESRLEIIAEKYHFEDRKEELRDAFFSVRAAIKDQERYEVLLDEETLVADIAITLGSLVDIYQEKMADRGEMMKDLMCEQICWDVLAMGYIKVRDDLCQNHGLTMERMYFWGGDAEYPLEKMAEVVAKMHHIPLEISHALSLIPSKSAVFRADLAPVESMAHHSLDLCSTCNRKGDCEYHHDEGLSD